MKKISVLVFALFLNTIINAQSKYEKEMQLAIKSLSEKKELQSFKKIANKFEQISSIEKNKWQPKYYVAYTYTVMTRIGQGDSKSKDLLLDKAQKFIDKATALSQNNEEIIILQGYIDQSRFFADPSNRIQSFKKTTRIISDAVKLYPNNPRANLIHGIQTFHKPAFFGGGSKKAKPYFDKTKNLFDNDNSTKNSLDPNWGKDTNDYYSEQCE